MRLFFTLFLVFFALPAYAEAPKRLVAIGGALTETVYALGAADLLVGADTTSYYPEAAAQLPKVGYQRALSAEGILSLNPDMILLTDQAGPPAVLRQLESAGVALLTLQAPRTLEEVKQTITAIGAALERQPQAETLISQLEKDAATLRAKVSHTSHTPAVMFMLQHGGGAPMVAGRDTAADRMIALSGGRNVVDDYEGYKPLNPESALALQPEVLLITHQGLEQAGGKDALLASPAIALTPAGKQKRIIAMDSLYLLGFGPRTAQAALELHQHYHAKHD